MAADETREIPDFHSRFMMKFINEKLKINELSIGDQSQRYFKVKYDDKLDHLKFVNDSLTDKYVSSRF